MGINTETLIDAAKRGISVGQLLDEMLGNRVTPALTNVERTTDGFTATVRAEPRQRRQRARSNRVAMRKHYRLITKRNGKLAADPKDARAAYPAAYRAVYDYIVKESRKASTLKDGLESFAITSALNIPHKTTESALYHLRVGTYSGGVALVESIVPAAK